MSVSFLCQSPFPQFWSRFPEKASDHPLPYFSSITVTHSIVRYPSYSVEDMSEQLNRKVFFKKTRKGKVVQPVQESYLHADLECGFMCGKSVSMNVLRDITAQAPHKHLLIIDTNIAMHQVDVLEYNCPNTSMIVIMQTVLQELKHLNANIYARILQLVKDTSKSFIFFPNELSSNTCVLRYTNMVIDP